MKEILLCLLACCVTNAMDTVNLLPGPVICFTDEGGFRKSTLGEINRYCNQVIGKHIRFNINNWQLLNQDNREIPEYKYNENLINMMSMQWDSSFRRVERIVSLKPENTRRNFHQNELPFRSSKFGQALLQRLLIENIDGVLLYLTSDLKESKVTDLITFLVSLKKTKTIKYVLLRLAPEDSMNNHILQTYDGYINGYLRFKSLSAVFQDRDNEDPIFPGINQQIQDKTPWFKTFPIIIPRLQHTDMRTGMITLQEKEKLCNYIWDERMEWRLSVSFKDAFIGRNDSDFVMLDTIKSMETLLTFLKAKQFGGFALRVSQADFSTQETCPLQFKDTLEAVFKIWHNFDVDNITKREEEVLHHLFDLPKPNDKIPPYPIFPEKNFEHVISPYWVNKPGPKYPDIKVRPAPAPVDPKVKPKETSPEPPKTSTLYVTPKITYPPREAKLVVPIVDVKTPTNPYNPKKPINKITVPTLFTNGDKKKNGEFTSEIYMTLKNKNKVNNVNDTNTFKPYFETTTVCLTNTSTGKPGSSVTPKHKSFVTEKREIFLIKNEKVYRPPEPTRAPNWTPILSIDKEKAYPIEPTSRPASIYDSPTTNFPELIIVGDEVYLPPKSKRNSQNFEDSNDPEPVKEGKVPKYVIDDDKVFKIKYEIEDDPRKSALLDETPMTPVFKVIEGTVFPIAETYDALARQDINVRNFEDDTHAVIKGVVYKVPSDNLKKRNSFQIIKKDLDITRLTPQFILKDDKILTVSKSIKERDFIQGRSMEAYESKEKTTDYLIVSSHFYPLDYFFEKENTSSGESSKPQDEKIRKLFDDQVGSLEKMIASLSDDELDVPNPY